MHRRVPSGIVKRTVRPREVSPRTGTERQPAPSLCRGPRYHSDPSPALGCIRSGEGVTGWRLRRASLPALWQHPRPPPQGPGALLCSWCGSPQSRGPERIPQAGVPAPQEPPRPGLCPGPGTAPARGPAGAPASFHPGTLPAARGPGPPPRPQTLTYDWLLEALPSPTNVDDWKARIARADPDFTPPR